MSLELSPIERAARQEYEYYGSTLTTNTALKAGLLACLGVVCLLAVQVIHLSKEVVARKPLIVRVNEVGKAEAVDYHYRDYTPQDAEIRYFLNSFITSFYGRSHATLKTDYPASLAYLAPAKYTEVDGVDRKSQWAAKFLISSDDDARIEVKNIALDESQKPVYRAEVQYIKVYVSSAGSETKRENYTAKLAFRIDPNQAARNNEMVRLNPLGFSIFWLQSYQAFQQ
jgi:type IV secretory pathway TrbF-like protein